MENENSVNDVFRFMQLRPIRTAKETPTIPLLGETPFAIKVLAATSMAERAAMAEGAFKSGREIVRNLEDLSLGEKIVEALAELRSQADASTKDLRERFPAGQEADRGIRDSRTKLSNTLLASYFATQNFPDDLEALQDVYRVYDLIAQAADEGATPLAEYLERRILIPFDRAGQFDSSPARSKTVPTTKGASGDSIQLHNAIKELARLDLPENLVQPLASGLASARGSLPFTLTAGARRDISGPTLVLLRTHGVDLAAMPIDAAITKLTGNLAVSLAGVIDWPRPIVIQQPGATLPPPPLHSLVKPAGVADLLVVKQQIKRYEGGEIAHVENVLIGEKKSRAQRELERSEQTYSTDTETTQEKQTEVQTADRFELNRETSQTIQSDMKASGSLTLSDKYGPTTSMTATVTQSFGSSSQSVTKNSTRFAHDVMNRSVERITQRVREQRSTTLIHESEETNLHELHNRTEKHVRGVYQFLDKVYEAQVFNYGIREMFDFMVPEPASFLWHIVEHPNLDLKLSPPPENLDAIAPDASFITELNAAALAAKFGATEIEPPPPPYRLLTVGVKHGDDNADESDNPRSVSRLEAQVPAGYTPVRARVYGLALTDDASEPHAGITIGSSQMIWNGATGKMKLSGGFWMAKTSVLYADLSEQGLDFTTESKLGISVIAYETNSYSFEFSIVLQRTPDGLTRWRYDTYKKIRAAYEDAVREYNQKVEEARKAAEALAEKNQPFGAPPSENTRTIETELKKHCISIITQQRYDAFDATRDGTPPYFDFLDAAAEGAYIRFFEQAFEWDQMQYVFYPYFWSRKNTWVNRFLKQDVDPNFLEFVKAGSARVVVPVRPGFEVAVTHYIETGKIWGGDGEPPQINSPLYVSIVDEIKERTGAPQGEKPVGDPWDVRVPTALVLVRENDAPLPEWKRVAPDAWDWRPVENPS